jgi:Zn finger protein HypA/HybF involved in hydrogenase expression
MKEEWIDGDKLNCIKCDRSVESINNEGLCPECEEEEYNKERSN